MHTFNFLPKTTVDLKNLSISSARKNVHSFNKNKNTQHYNTNTFLNSPLIQS